MSDPVTQYQAQNREIINANVKLKERISFLEAVITKLQDENQQLRLDQFRHQYGDNSGSSSSSSTSDSSSDTEARNAMIQQNRSDRKRALTTANTTPKTHVTRTTKSKAASNRSNRSRNSKRSKKRFGTKKNHAKTSSDSFSMAVKLSKREIPKVESNDTITLENDSSSSTSENTRKKRRCAAKPVNYTLPSIRSKLRKGDPFTFGNTTIIE